MNSVLIVCCSRLAEGVSPRHNDCCGVFGLLQVTPVRMGLETDRLCYNSIQARRLEDQTISLWISQYSRVFNLHVAKACTMQ